MQSRKSFFNKTIFFKNIKQFWPIWASYLAVLLIAGPITLYDQNRWDTLIRPVTIEFDILRIGTEAGLIFSAIWGVISAMAVSDYMYNPRSAGFFTSLPVTRRSLYITQYATGIGWIFAADILAALMYIAVEAALGTVQIAATAQWLALLMMFNVLFYGMGIFCSIVTGQRMAVIPFYIVMNYGANIFEKLVRHIMGILVYGFEAGKLMLLDFLSPILKLGSFSVIYTNYEDSGEFGIVPTLVKYDGWKALAIYAAAAVVLSVISYFIFKKRHMESASDIIAVRALKPVFRIGVGLGSALVGGCFFNLIYSFFSDYTAAFPFCIYMVVSAFIGFFGAEMLVEKSFRVFNKKRWLEFIAICAVIVLFIVGLDMDLFKIESRVPEVSKVDSVEIYCNASYSSKFTTDDAEMIENIRALQKKILSEKDKKIDTFDISRLETTVYFNYKLKNGKSVTRSYDVSAWERDFENPDSIAWRLDSILNSKEAIAKRMNFDFTISQMSQGYGKVDGWTVVEDGQVWHDGFELDTDEIRNLYYNFIKPDVENGYIGKIDVIGKGSTVSEGEIGATYYEIYLDIFAPLTDEEYSYLTITVNDPQSETFRYIAEIYAEQENN